MAPRPTPDDNSSLFAEEKPYIQQGRRRRSSGLMLSGLHNDLSKKDSAGENNYDIWDDELVGGGSSIELTHSSATSSSSGSASGSGDDDPLFASLQRDEEVACLHDGEIAALMAAEWNAEVLQKRRKMMSASAVQQEEEPLSFGQKCIGCAWLLLVVLGLMGLGVYAVLFGLGDGSNHHHHHSSAGTYQCPTSDHPLALPSLQQLIKEQAAGNNTSVCRSDVDDCTCQNPTSSPQAKDINGLDAELVKEATMLKRENNLDVVFVGPFSDVLTGDPVWTSYQFRKAHIASEDNVRSSSVLYRFDKQGAIPAKVQPKVWWISLGRQDLLVDGCSMDAVHTGTYHLVQRVLGRSGMDVKIILSPPPPPPPRNNNEEDDAALLLLLSDWNHRLQCIAAMNSQVEAYDPYTVVQDDDEEEDDDFFLDVSSGSSTSSSSSASSSSSVASAEEAQQAVVNKLVELLH